MRNSSTTRILFAGWGTGWHVTPILSLYHFMKEEDKNIKSLWLWERDSLEQEAALKNNIEFHDIAAGKIRRYFDVRNFYEPLKNLTGLFQAFYFILKFKPTLIFSKWGYVSVPVCLAAFVLKKKIYIHESDTVMGSANKFASKFATKVFFSFPNEKIDGKKYIHSWPLVNPELLDGLTNMKPDENERLSVLVIAGSQWSQRIFTNLLEILPDCKDIDFNIILWTQNSDFKSSFDNFLNVKTHGYISQKDLWKIMKNSDIAITRGSSTLWELYYFGIHSIIIPLKATGWNHQTHNWEYFKKEFESDLLDEDSDTLNLDIFRKLQNYKTLRKAKLNLEWFLDWLQSIESEIK
jgi:UDP-N-acetylglucosamine--N-acetylmuramyl-(pentapeptide) pyrophosphoryl-undecaprenol N-acetylglucosamine transferase